MSWSMSEWVQNDESNLGFPYVGEAGAPVLFNLDNANSAWSISANKNLGFPYYTATGTPAIFDLDKANSIWKFHPKVNLGFPFIVTIEEIPPDVPVFPVFTKFSAEGLGADFKQQKSVISLNIPADMAFSFRMSDSVEFHFSDMKEVIL